MKTNFVLITALICGFYSCSGEAESNETTENSNASEKTEVAVGLFSEDNFNTVSRGNVLSTDSCFSTTIDAIVKVDGNRSVVSIRLTKYTSVDEYIEYQKSREEDIVDKNLIMSEELTGFTYASNSGNNWCCLAILNNSGQVCAINITEKYLNDYVELLPYVSKDGSGGFPNTGLSFNYEGGDYVASCSRKEWIISYDNSTDCVVYRRGYSSFDDMSFVEYAAEYEYEIVDTFSFENGARGIRTKMDETIEFEASFENEAGSLYFIDDSEDGFNISDEDYEDLKHFISNLK